MKAITKLGLSILGCIVKLTGKKVNFSISDDKNSIAISHTVWNTLLKKNVTKEGFVNYKGFINEKNRLIEYTSLLSNNPPSTNWTKDEQLAYWINAYNAFTVLLVINHYPIKSIKDIGVNIPKINSVWNIKFFKIGTVDFDLDTIEHEILRKQFEEPRIHFAINCASISCPRLRNEAYIATKIEEQLEEQAVYFMTHPTYNKITAGHVHLSKIFDWFKSDFTKKQDILQFLEKYVSVTFDDKVILEYFPYNWNLNELKN